MEAAEQNKLIEHYPILADLKEAKEIVWIQTKLLRQKGLPEHLLEWQILMMRKKDLRDLRRLSSGVSRKPRSATV